MNKLAGVLIVVVLFGIALAWWADGHPQHKKSFTVTNDTSKEVTVSVADMEPAITGTTYSSEVYTYRAGDLSKESLAEIRKIVREEITASAKCSLEDTTNCGFGEVGIKLLKQAPSGSVDSFDAARTEAIRKLVERDIEKFISARKAAGQLSVVVVCDRPANEACDKADYDRLVAEQERNRK